SRAFTFHPDCTLPPDGASYVAGPSTRSTLGIVWNCLSVILLCTWSIQHLNVPPIRRPDGLLDKMWSAVQGAAIKVKWMVIATFAPEYLVGRALSELYAAKAVLGDMAGKFHGKEWGLIHCYLANMGYFVLDAEEATDLAQGYAPVEATWELGERSGLPHVPDIPAVYLEKLDRGGALVKVLAIGQVSYLILQLACRAAKGLPTAQLEVATLAFSAVSLVTYGLYWVHPQDV
ncbi:hypothetical protein BR93DRAFT_865529, partial [Coniochaeta sp. PMI_546]